MIMKIEMNPRAVSLDTALAAHKLAQQLHAEDCRTPGEQAIRALRAQDPALMRWLEQAVEVMDQAHERLRGETMRTSKDAGRATSGELGLWRGAYETALRQADTPRSDLMVFVFIYGAAAVLSGIAPRPHLQRAA